MRLGNGYQRWNRVRFNPSILIQQEDKVGIVIKSVFDADIVGLPEAEIVMIGEEGDVGETSGEVLHYRFWRSVIHRYHFQRKDAVGQAAETAVAPFHSIVGHYDNKDSHITNV